MTDEEDVTAQLLRLAGAPSDPSAERSARVREVVRREWLVGRRRRMVRRGAVIALLGVAASLVMAVWMNRPHSMAPPDSGAAGHSAPIPASRGSTATERVQLGLPWRSDPDR